MEFLACDWVERDSFGSPCIIEYPELPATQDWNYQAFLAHFVTGLHDVYEHTFDSWNRPFKKEGQELLVVDYRLEQVARQLDCSVALADQWLAYRTLSTRVPFALMEFFSVNYRELPAQPPKLFFKSDVFGKLVSLFDLNSENELRWLYPNDFSLEVARAKLFPLLFSFDELEWELTLSQISDDTFWINTDKLGLVCEAITDNDTSGRIGTLPEGLNSDQALLLLMHARIKNLKAPYALWKAILSDGPKNFDTEQGWLKLPPVYRENKKATSAG
jgi:hypothetical protein